MIISSQGFGHYTQGVNNQDFGIELPNMLLIFDGCSGSKHSEVGTRLFAQLFEKREQANSLELFEHNVKEVFDEIVSLVSFSFNKNEEDINNFIMENMLFTILACFEEEDKFIVKALGDGYIVSQNKLDMVSYMRMHYGPCPPYFAYRYCSLDTAVDYKSCSFKTFVFPKDGFKTVGVATDGIAPIAKGELRNFDKNITQKSSASARFFISNNKQRFTDDVTIGVHGWDGGKI